MNTAEKPLIGLFKEYMAFLKWPTLGSLELSSIPN